MSDPVALIYDRWASYQWGRLDVQRAELHVHLLALCRHLRPGDRVLDVGAGPGRYAIELARRGHRVAVGDLSPRLVEMARERIAAAGVGDRVDGVEVLDARDLGRFADGSFDAVISFGPFYHLKEEGERRQAAREAARVLRPGGVLFASFMPRPFWLSQALHGFLLAPPESTPPEHLAHLEQFWEGGSLARLKSDQLRQSWFCRLEEIAPLLAAAGFQEVERLASSGVAATWSRAEVWEALERRGPEIARRVLDLIARTAAEPGLLALSDQVLVIGRKEERP